MRLLSDRTTRWRRARRFLPVLAAAVISLALSGSVWWVVSLREQRLAQLEFSARANDQALTLQKGIDHYMDKVAALRALFESSEHGVTRGEFATFTGLLLRDQAAILATSWIPLVTRQQRAEHELAAVRDGLPDYHITSAAPDGSLVPAPDLSEYFPVLYSSTEIPGSPVYGLNLNDGGIRQHTLERARDGDLLASSPDFALHSGQGDRNGFFVALPVYRQGVPHDTVQSRRRNLLGFVQGVFQTSVMIETILATTTATADMDLYFYRPGSTSDSSPLYSHVSRSRTVAIGAQPRAALGTGLHWSGELSVGDNQWQFVATPSPGAAGTASHDRPWIVLAGALLVSVVVVAYIWASGRHARRLQAANKQLDRTLGMLNVANAQLQGQNVRFDAALNNMSQGLLMFDSDERIVVCNDRYIEMYGLSREIVKPGCSLRELFRHRAESGHLTRDPEQYRALLLAELETGKTPNWVIETADGREMSVTNRTMSGGGWVATHDDITERRRAEAKVSHMALHDELTSLPNRRFFGNQVENRIARMERDQTFAVLCLDLDRFKSVNDTLGHSFGDNLLRQVAIRLQSCLREGDAVARMGGDEFAILQGSLTQPTEITALAARVIEAISAPFDLDGQQVVVGASVGIAIAPTDAADSDQLLKNADMALYRAKADGRGTYRFFEPKMDALMQERRALELDLRKALINGELELYYQPLVNLATEDICGFEALLRWNHPERGIIAPLEFIPLAEETALIVPIGEWVLRQACQEAVKWPSHVSIAVNVSPAQFTARNLSQTVMSALAGSGLPAQRLELEITESVLLLGSESTLATLHQLRKMGVRISMDDFGTGYSSLSYLRSFPFDKIKIDRSFVHDVSSNEDSMAIIRAVTGLGSSLRITTIGEGVETQDELDYLRREGCIEAQGYFFGRPEPALEASKMLERCALKLRSVA